MSPVRVVSYTRLPPVDRRRRALARGQAWLGWRGRGWPGCVLLAGFADVGMGRPGEPAGAGPAARGRGGRLVRCGGGRRPGPARYRPSSVDVVLGRLAAADVAVWPRLPAGSATVGGRLAGSRGHRTAQRLTRPHVFQVRRLTTRLLHDGGSRVVGLFPVHLTVSRRAGRGIFFCRPWAGRAAAAPPCRGVRVAAVTCGDQIAELSLPHPGHAGEVAMRQPARVGFAVIVR